MSFGSVADGMPILNMHMVSITVRTWMVCGSGG
jgi:hypothetical protein